MQSAKSFVYFGQSAGYFVYLAVRISDTIQISNLSYKQATSSLLVGCWWQSSGDSSDNIAEKNILAVQQK